MPGINMMPSGSTLQIPLDACTNFSGEAGNAQVTLTWTDPKDKYATPEGETAQDPDQLVSVWEYTQIIRKTGSQPTGPHDGELVVSSSVRDQYATTGFVDDGLTNDTLYYYAAFAYNTDGVASEGAFTSATPMAGTPLSELAEGTLIKILENGAPVEFYVAKQDYESGLNGAGRVLCVRKDCYDKRAYNSTNYNNYIGSQLDEWLNSSYKTRFSSFVQTKMGTTKFYVTNMGDASYGDSSIPVSTYERSVFSLSCAEMAGPDSWDGSSSPYYNNEGSKLSVADIIYVANFNGNPTIYWSRTPCLIYYNNRFDTTDTYAVGNSTGTLWHGLSSASNGSRPVFTLPNTLWVDAELTLIEEEPPQAVAA